MSTQEIGALIQSVNNMTGTVAGKMGQIDQRMDQAETEFDQFMVQARLENAIFRQSKNQYCNLTANSLDFFTKNSQYTIDVSLYRVINPGTPWSQRDSEEQEILTAMGMTGTQYFQPAIRVMRMAWSGYQSGIHSSYTMFPNPVGNASGMVTTASYAKLVSGSISEWWLYGVTTQWGLCGQHFSGQPGRYLHAHPRVGSDSGEVLFIWPAIVSGYVPLNKNSPKWGYWPSMYGENPYDAQPGS
ncbi:hypothetical protein J8Z24_18095 [Pseudoalteromonas sp. SCSIO 43201]|uniref:hypothetical protein n=1 Tax=Pseudoalteromonas sp. SCSIO 43201 TaxID=2822842 RepID=UPI00207650A0|nr:hypothetical protein [Pseudoalteromonas sp. SCSIO 43201]USD30873.1 hypothetical protein J8Z24_18095 [Pseudoalteromonas sp. SCSIO 43201]